MIDTSLEFFLKKSDICKGKLGYFKKLLMQQALKNVDEIFSKIFHQLW